MAQAQKKKSSTERLRDKANVTFWIFVAASEKANWPRPDPSRARNDQNATCDATALAVVHNHGVAEDVMIREPRGDCDAVRCAAALRVRGVLDCGPRIGLKARAEVMAHRVAGAIHALVDVDAASVGGPC